MVSIKNIASFIKTGLFFTIFFLFPQLLFSTQNYDYAIKWAREGHYEKALEVLERFYRHEPQNRQLLYDYITVLSWAGQDNKALTLSQKIDIASTPAYVLHSIGKSARNTKKYKMAVRTYIAGAKHFPKDSAFYKALALTLQENGKNLLAVAVLKQAVQKFPQQNDLKLTLASIYENQKNFFDAMVIYQDLETNPKLHKKVIVKLVGTLRRLGMVFKAQKYVDQNPELFDNAFKTAIQSDQAAYKLRWYTQGLHAQGDTATAYHSLEKIEKVIASLKTQKADIQNNKRLQNACFDKIIALEALHREKEVIPLYDYLKNRQIKIPAYVLKAVAQAYLVLKKPGKAQQLLLEALRQRPEDFTLKVQLFYAYSDAYDMKKALQWARNMNRYEPVKIWDNNHLHKIINPRKDDTIFLYTLALAYSGYTPKAYEKLEYIVAKAPMNRWYREELAKFYLYRGWYDKAKKQIKLMQTSTPYSFKTKALKTKIEIAQKEYRKGYETLQELALLYPYQKRKLTDLYKYYQEHTKGIYEVETLFNRGDQTSPGENTDGYHIKTAVYTPLLNYHWRLGMFGDFLQSKFTRTKLNSRRFGLAAAYVSKSLDADLKLAYQETIIRKLAPSIDFTWRINDFFSLGGGYANFWDGTPDRAILNGIRSDHFHTNVMYRKNESNHIALEYSRTDYTDGNTQDNVALTLSGRMIYGPFYTLDGRIYSGMSNNSMTNRAYYAPEEESYITLALINSWSLYRLYERKIVQNIEMNIGKHWEKGYNSKITGALVLSQTWLWDEDFEFNLGYKRERTSYDGNIEYFNQLFLNLSGKF